MSNFREGTTRQPSGVDPEFYIVDGVLVPVPNELDLEIDNIDFDFGAELEEFYNKNHGEDGRFDSGDGGIAPNIIKTGYAKAGEATRGVIGHRSAEQKAAGVEHGGTTVKNAIGNVGKTATKIGSSTKDLLKKVDELSVDDLEKLDSHLETTQKLLKAASVIVPIVGVPVSALTDGAAAPGFATASKGLNSSHKGVVEARKLVQNAINRKKAAGEKPKGTGKSSDGIAEVANLVKDLNDSVVAAKAAKKADAKKAKDRGMDSRNK